MASLTIGLSLATFTFTRLPLPAPLALSSSVAFSCFRFRIQHTVFPKRHHSHHRFCSMASSVPAQEVATAPYGSWKSPITADLVSGASKRLGGTAVDGQGRLLVLESRPNEGGRSVLVRLAEKTGDEPVDVTPKDFGVRTTCQEYGGGAFAVSGDTVIFSNYKDQRLYKQTVDGQDSMPVPLTPDYGGPVITYADGVFDYRFNRYLTVREDCRKSSTNGTTTIVSVGLNEKDIQEPTVLVGGNDFYAFPRLDPKGERMAWIEWGHPNMPWDKSELWVGYISEKGEIYKRTCVAGYDPSLVESPTEPKWSSNGELFFVTDRKSGFWNIYKWIESENSVQEVYSLDAEFSKPLWVFGSSSYVLLQSNEGTNLIACGYRQKGRSYFSIVDDAQSSISLLDIPFTDIDNITSGNHCLYIEGASGISPSSVAKVTLDGHGSKVLEFNIVWSSSPDSLKYKSYFSLPEFIEFPTEVPGQNAYAYFYPPSNPDYQASQGEKPPLLLKSHGGPTAEARGILNMSVQYWTSRGWAFVDVNYGGSTGYGREYRERLLLKWGIVDVNDCCSCANFLVDSGLADGNRLCITGGSAGGYTTLAALAFKNTFKAGASLYGVVPPDQARKIYEALKKKGLPVALVEYEGEQHGFRKAENIKFTLEQQMVFFARLVGHFNVADKITPIKIENFDEK
ncbi:Dipeptidyl peptidase family member 6 [Linum perenne]